MTGCAWRDYALIRDEIEKVFDDFHDYNARRQAGRLPPESGVARARMDTGSGKAQFMATRSTATRRSTAPARCTAKRLMT
jgi:hypothetical protein